MHRKSANSTFRVLTACESELPDIRPLPARPHLARRNDSHKTHKSTKGILIFPFCAFVPLVANLSSEEQLHSKLNLPGRTQVTTRGSRRGDLAKIAGGNRAIGLCEVRVIENIKRFGAELQVHPFLNRRHLGK